MCKDKMKETMVRPPTTPSWIHSQEDGLRKEEDWCDSVKF